MAYGRAAMTSPWWSPSGTCHYRTPVVRRVSETLGKIHKTLGKCTRRTALVKNSDDKANFAECLLSGTRQSLCECPTLGKVETEKNPKK